MRGSRRATHEPSTACNQGQASGAVQRLAMSSESETMLKKTKPSDYIRGWEQKG